MYHDSDLIILDADGVVFSRELDRFIRDRGAECGEDPDSTVHRWRKSLRRPFLTGGIPPSEMWKALFPGENPAALTAELERRYRPGPLFDVAARGDRRMWLFTNDRSGWLLPRLRRFDLLDSFERIVVSDQIGHITPDEAAFSPILQTMRYDTVVQIDDDPTVVKSAIQLGINARLPHDLTPLDNASIAIAA